jgi:branched-chain amino acid aminotransferase
MSLVPYDDRDGWIWFDGQFTPWREAKVHVLTHGLHYASAVFEGERMYGGEIFKLTEHTERLFKSAEILDFAIPFTVAQIDAACKDLRQERPDRLLHAADRLARIGDDRRLGPGKQDPRGDRRLGLAELFQSRGEGQGHRPDLGQVQTPSPETAPTASKAAGLYMICTISKHAAEREGFADAMMLDWRGYVAEATGANVFFVRDGV